jgi:hypothetical protein
MASITEAALQGEWFYLVEDQSFDRTSREFYVLDRGEVRLGTSPEAVGVYTLGDDYVAIRLHRAIPFTTTITLSSNDATFNKTTRILAADATHTLPDGSDPLYLYGTFIRRVADYPSVCDVWRRVR